MDTAHAGGLRSEKASAISSVVCDLVRKPVPLFGITATDGQPVADRPTRNPADFTTNLTTCLILPPCAAMRKTIAACAILVALIAVLTYVGVRAPDLGRARAHAGDVRRSSSAVDWPALPPNRLRRPDRRSLWRITGVQPRPSPLDRARSRQFMDGLHPRSWSARKRQRADARWRRRRSSTRRPPASRD